MTIAASTFADVPSVLLLHGQPGRGADWRHVAARLAPDFRVVAPDRPGYGQTGGLAIGFEANAGAALGLLDRLGIERATVAGHSWGGGVALALAERHPDRVAGLVLAASVGTAARFDPVDRLLAARVAGPAISWVGFKTLSRLLATPRVRRTIGRRLAGLGEDELAEAASLYDADTWRSFTVEQRALFTELPRLAAGLKSIDTPTVVVAGGADRIVSPKQLKALAAAIPGAIYREIPKAHHFLLHEASDELATLISQVAAEARLRGVAAEAVEN